MIPVEKPGSTRALTLGTLAFALSFMVWGLVSPLAPTLQKLLSLSNTQVSLLIAVPVLLGSVGRLPLGMLTDQFGGRRVFSVLLAFQFLPLVLMALCRTYVQMLGASFLLGIAGASFAVGVPFVSKWFRPEKQGLALGIYGAGNIGQAGAAMLAPRIADAWGWPAAFWVMLLPIALFTVAFAFLARDVQPPARTSAFLTNLKAVQGDSTAWLLAFFYFLTFGGFVAFSNYIPKLYVDLFHLSRAGAGTYAAFFVFMATAMRPIGGWLADKVGGARILPWLFAAAGLLALTLLTGPGLAGTQGVIVAIGLLFGLGNGVVFKLVPQYFPKQTGTVTGIVGAMGGLGGFFPPLLMGMFRDWQGSYDGGFLLLALFAGVSFIGALLLALGRWPVGGVQRSSEVA
jgi:NNP family nitrate/nitrite transporter-like MFS transporter